MDKIKKLIFVTIKVMLIIVGAYFVHLGGITSCNVELPVSTKDLFNSAHPSFYYITLPVGIGLAMIFAAAFLENLIRIIGDFAKEL
jgi:hypothetical protein